MIRPDYRGTRGGEKQRKRLFYQLVDEVRGIFRRLFPGATWVRIEFASSTQALPSDLESIVANPHDALNPAWQSRAAFSPTLRRFIPAGAPQGAAQPPQQATEEEAEEDQPANEPGQASGERCSRKRLKKEIHLVLLRQSPSQLLPARRQLTRSSNIRPLATQNRTWPT